MTDREIDRRSVLKRVGAGIAGATVATGTGTATSGPPDDQYVVGLDPVSPSALDTVRTEAKEIRTEVSLGDIRNVVIGRFSPEARSRLESSPGVDYVEPDGSLEKHAQTLPWGVDRIDADVLQSNGQTGGGISVAVLDTGIDDDHPDLPTPVQGKCFVTDCCGSASCDNGNTCNNAWTDDDDHGTHVAGTIAAVNNSKGVIGASPGVDLMAGKVLNGCGTASSYDPIINGIKWAADNGADVINMSLGAGSGSTGLKDACQYAYDNNVVVVASAGNPGDCSCDCDAGCSSCSVSYPAQYSTVIAVSALGRDDGFAAYSAKGPSVELAAPGGYLCDSDNSTSVLSTTYTKRADTDGDGTNERYSYFNGTSMAAPHVAASAALVKSATPLSNNQDIRDRLNETAEPLDLSSEKQGRGLVDPKAAVDAVGTIGRSPVEAGTTSVSQPDGKTWHPVSTASSYADPVVVAGPPTYNGGQPATIRVRNVGSSGFEFQLDEWDYLDGAHISEDVGYLVAEAGTGTIGGATAEAGHVTIDHNWTSVSFSASFSTAPVVVPQCATYVGPQAVTVRVRNVTASGFELRLQEEEGNDDLHADERVDFLAVEPVNASGVEAGTTEATDSATSVALDGFSTAPTVLTAMQTYVGPDSAATRITNRSSGGFDVLVEEEQSSDGETNHITETVGYLAIDGSSGTELARTTGTVSADQSGSTSWTTLSTSAAHSDPVVVAGPPTDNGGQPATIRVRNVGPSSFEFQIDEWNYLDGGHLTEDIGYAVIEAGTGTIGGATAEAGHVSNVESNWQSVSFSASFSTAPVVLPQCVTYNGPDAVTVRVRNVTTGGCEIRLQEEEGNDDIHTDERVDYVAVEPVNASGFEAGTTGNVVTDSATSVSLDGFSTAPTVLAALQTYDGPDPVAARLDSRSSSGFSVYAQEEQSGDSETIHTDEVLGYVAFD